MKIRSNGFIVFVPKYVFFQTYGFTLLPFTLIDMTCFEFPQIKKRMLIAGTENIVEVLILNHCWGVGVLNFDVSELTSLN